MTGDFDSAAGDLDEVRNAFLDTVGIAARSPDSIVPEWSGQSADACAVRLAAETESARKLANELDEVAASLRSVGRRLDSAKQFVERVASEIDHDPHGLVVYDDWRVNISPIALIPTSDTDPERARQAIAERQEQMSSAVLFLADEDRACAQILAEAMEHAAQFGRQLDLFAAFERVMGRPPETANDMITASMLDAASEDAKYDGTDAEVVMGRIRPQPGMGLVRTEMFIPVDSVFNAGLVPPRIENDLGDMRSASSTPTPGDARVELVIDYENGLVVARQNPSVTESGDVRVDAPRVDVQQLTTGDVRINYNAANPFAFLGGWPSHKVNGEFAVSTRDGILEVGGTVSKYPSLEIYHHHGDGTVRALVIADAEDRSEYGPLMDLPSSQYLGDHTVVEPFEDYGNSEVFLHGDSVAVPSHPGETRLESVDSDVRVPVVPPQS